MRPFILAVCGLLFVTFRAFSDGPDDRKATNPRFVTSAIKPKAAPLPVDAMLESTRTYAIAHTKDGGKITYMSNASGRLNIWIMNADGSQARQLTSSNDRQFTPHFTPDEKAIVYSQDRGGNEYNDVYLVPVSGGEPRNLTHTDEIGETAIEFSHDGHLLALEIKPKTSPQTNLAVMQWPGGSIRQLTHETDPKASWNENAWSPDSKFLFATRSLGIDTSEIYRIEVATGKNEQLLKHVDKQLITVSGASSDGRTLLVTSNAKGGYSNVALLDLKSRELRWLTNTQWSAEGMAFSPDGEMAVYVQNADGRMAVRFVDLKTKRESERGVPVGMNVVPFVPFLPDGSMLLSHEDSSHPQEFFRLAKDNTLTQITHNANETLRRAVLPRSQLVTYKSFDGRLISAFVWIPLNLKRDGTAPAVVMPHGGPANQTTDTFNGRAQLLASRGFAVIAPNVRGSTGYGMEFQNANIKDLGGADLKDEIAGLDFLKATGFIDSRRIGIWGGSYGGFLTLMAVGKTPKLWSAAVDEFGILNWFTMLQHSDPNLQEYEKQILGDPVKNRSVYEASSPLKYIRQEKAPLLVLQGANDIRVPKEEAEQLVSILRAEGKTVEAIYYPDEGHGFFKRETQRDELTRSVAWLQKFLSPKR